MEVSNEVVQDLLEFAKNLRNPPLRLFFIEEDSAFPFEKGDVGRLPAVRK